MIANEHTEIVEANLPLPTLDLPLTIHVPMSHPWSSFTCVQLQYRAHIRTQRLPVAISLYRLTFHAPDSASSWNLTHNRVIPQTAVYQKDGNTYERRSRKHSLWTLTYEALSLPSLTISRKRSLSALTFLRCRA